MKKFLLFLYSGKQLDRLQVDNINLNSVDIIKKDLAFEHGVQVDDIDVQFEDEAQAEPTANYYVDASGLLMLDSPLKNREVEGVRQAHPLDTIDEINFFLENFNGDIECLLYLKAKSL